MPKPLRKQSKELVSALISYFERERDNGGPLLPLSAVRERVANALQLSLSSVNRISTIRRCGFPQTSPKKTRPRRKPVTAVDETIQAEIRNQIYDMYKE
jgi:hypothetical protein